MRVFYIGYLFPEAEYYSNKAMSFAAGRFEKGLILGLNNQSIVKLDINSIEPTLGKYPKARLFVKSRTIELDSSIIGKSVSYLNLPFMKHIWLFISLLIRIILWKKHAGKEPTVIISYNADVPLIQLGLFAEKIHIKYVPLIADLPFYNSNRNDNTMKAFLSRIGYNSQIKKLSRIKNAIVLNENVAKDFGIKDYIVIDGAITNAEECRGIETINHKNKTIMYCGSLDEFHGVDKVLSLSKILLDYVFIICGRGFKWVNTLKKASLENSNLFFHEDVSNEQLNELYKEASLLIIPHPTNYMQLRYQFPSKLMTCMSTGIPTLTTPLPGISSDYKDYVLISENDDVESLASIITMFFSIPYEERIAFGKKSREYVLKNKNWRVQSSKILTFLEEVIDDEKSTKNDVQVTNKGGRESI